MKTIRAYGDEKIWGRSWGGRGQELGRSDAAAPLACRHVLVQLTLGLSLLSQRPFAAS